MKTKRASQYRFGKEEEVLISLKSEKNWRMDTFYSEIFRQNCSKSTGPGAPGFLIRSDYILIDFAWISIAGSCPTKLIMNTKLVTVFLFCLLASMGFTLAQTIKAGAFDGIVVAGYVDRGGFTNFTGPNINWVKGNSRLVLSALPSLRYKQDTGATQNTFVTPTLGIGLTYAYKLWAIQLPFYYNSKTSTENGRWHVGIGVGLRLNNLNQPRPE